MPDKVDILEDGIYALSPALLNTLLKDHTMSKGETQRNIFWATSDYEHLGEGYEYDAPILAENIIKEHGRVIKPRATKAKDIQMARVRDKAEVFTPAWICNAQINLIDNAWLGCEGLFNTEHEDCTWTPNPNKIIFPAHVTWRDYVRANRLEITCGEAPYVVSRYDVATGEPIALAQRIGMLDRKLRVVGENTETSGEWLRWAQEAYKSTYAYEWQGDNLLLAREALFISFIEYYQDKFKRIPTLKSMQYIAYIISWNVWQMDGLKGVVPNSCHDTITPLHPLLADGKTITKPCEGCSKKDVIKAVKQHNGKYCLIRDWKARDKEKRIIQFIDLVK